jgi:hypothetical protein
MRLVNALKVSEVEHKIDGDRKPTRARRKYPQFTKSDKYIVAYSSIHFDIVWADTMKIITSLRDSEYDKIFGYDDWEPM